MAEYERLRDGQLTAIIAESIADRSACEYCLPAHTVPGKKAWTASAEEMAAAQAGQAGDPKTQAALRFVLKVVNERGQGSDADVQSLRAAGFGGEAVPRWPPKIPQ